MDGSSGKRLSIPVPMCCLENVTMENSSMGQIYEVMLQSTNASKRSPQFVGVELLQSFKPLIIPCYALVVLVGVFGNYLLLYVICHTKKMHNVTNFFIGNLAFSDMLMCATCVPFTLAYAFNPRGWVFGRFMCYLVFLIQPVTVYVSVFTLTAIGVDRWVMHVRDVALDCVTNSLLHQCFTIIPGLCRAWLCNRLIQWINHVYYYSKEHSEKKRKKGILCIPRLHLFNLN